MTTTHPPRRANDAQAEAAAPQNVRAEQALAVLRIGFGLTFLWAFLDKLLALGFHTGAITDQNGNRTEIDVLARGEAWVNGGSPTAGFLSGLSEQNPLHGVAPSVCEPAASNKCGANSLVTSSVASL